MPYQFTAEPWIWDARKSDSWTFITLPEDASDELRARSMPSAGFGSIPVEVSVGQTVWQTSIFPDKASGCYVLPLKAAVQKAEQISVGSPLLVELAVRSEGD